MWGKWDGGHGMGVLQSVREELVMDRDQLAALVGRLSDERQALTEELRSRDETQAQMLAELTVLKTSLNALDL